MRLNRSIGSLVAFVLAVGPFGTATVSAQTAPSAPPAPAPDASAAPATTASIVGTARDAAGSALSGATISLVGPVRLTATSDANGRYSFPTVPPGLYSATATKPGFSSASNVDVTVLAGAPTPLDVTLVADSLSSLRTIATTRVGSARSTFNTSGTAVTVLGSAEIQARQQPNLEEELGELPGVVSSQDSGSRTPNSAFIVRGNELETKTTIDGHVLTNGVFGNYFTQFANSLIFDQAEVLKGAGLNGVNAGESAVGIVNLRTRDFTSKDSAQLQYGVDGFNSQFYQALVDVNLLKNNKLSLLATSVVQGVNGPDFGYKADQENTAGIPAAGYNAGTGSPVGTGLIQWNSDFSNTNSTRAQLLKARYRFSQSTALTLQFLGLQGLYEPQGGSYGYNYGNFTIAQCSNGSGRAATFTGACTPGSTYSSPGQFSQVGQTVPLFGFFPNSAIRNNEPQFSAEFRTSLKNDTFLLRPYIATVNRFIDGSSENTQPGYGTGAAVYASTNGVPNTGTAAPNPGWYMVTNPANCTAQFQYGHAAGQGGAATADGSSSGPCFTSQNVSSAYIGGTSSQFPTVYKTTTVAPTCSVATPCYTTLTNQQHNGYIGFSTPFSQPEEDRLHGTTFTYLHPVHDNLYTLSLDYNSDDTLRFSGDTSPLPAGCNGVVSSGKPNTPMLKVPVTAANPTGLMVNPYYQPACEVNGVVLPNLPATGLNIPPTQDRRFDYSATALLQVLPTVQLGLGAYYSQQRFYYARTNAAAALAASSVFYNPTTAAPNGASNLGGAEAAATSLKEGYTFNQHADPHVSLEWRPIGALSVRATGGSSVTFPYAALVSGFSTLTLNGGAGGTTDTLNQKNPALKPETTVAYDLGADYRLADGSVVSMDAFDNTIHNVFISTSQYITPQAGIPANFLELLSSTFNGPLQRSYGLEGTVQKVPTAGVGYRFDASLNRVYYDQIPLSFYGTTSFSPIVNGKQLDGTGGFTAQIPYFKARGELSYSPLSRHYSILFGDAFFGNNNGTGGPPYFNAYGSYSLQLAPKLNFQLSGQNLFNYSTGSFLGQEVAGAGFSPIGARRKTATGGLIYGPAFTAPNSIVVIQPRTLYFSLTQKY